MIRYATLFIAAAAICAQTGALKQPDAYGHVYVTDGSRGLRPTEKQAAKLSRTPAGSTVEIAGARAPVRVEAGPKLQFLLKLEAGKTPGSWNLFRFVVENGSRKLRFIPNLNAVKMTAGQQLDFRAELSGETYRLIPLEPLGPGEYGFSPSGSADTFLFGVDARAKN